MLLRTIVEALGKRAKKRLRKQKRPPRDTSPQRTSMPLAYALARSWAWPALKFRCETHPLEVSEIAADNRGETILHWTCLGKPPTDTVMAVLQVCPEMALVRNQAGHLPLHVAISYRASVEIVRALLEVFPESAGLRNGVGAYPLHLLCDYGSCVDSLCAVLETPEGAATIDKSMKGTERAFTPLYILNSRMNYPVVRRAIQSMREARKRQQATRDVLLQRRQQQHLQNEATVLDTSSASNESNAVAAFDRNERMISSFQQNDYWQKAALLALVSYTQRPLSPLGLEDDRANLVHACAGIPDCPSHLLEFAILLHMEDLIQKKDAQGRLPLHIAAQNHARSLVIPTSTKRKRHRQKTGGALRMILEACPTAAHAQDSNGDLPLALAVREIERLRENNLEVAASATKAWSSALQQLLDANIAALETLELGEGLYPHVWSQRMTSVDELFQSVRRHPDLFHHNSTAITRTADC